MQCGSLQLLARREPCASASQLQGSCATEYQQFCLVQHISSAHWSPCKLTNAWESGAGLKLGFRGMTWSTIDFVGAEPAALVDTDPGHADADWRRRHSQPRFRV